MAAMSSGTVTPPMNYRHAYHAGNFADVFKHVVLIAVLEALKAKPAPFCYFETHAGRGVYALDGREASKTHEAADGVLRLLARTDLPTPLQRYVELVRGLNQPAGEHATLRYPGSPLFADFLLRERDSAVFCELQAEEAAALRTLLRRRKAFHVHQRDGYEAMHALLPPASGRGLVLIDPPFEPQAEEFGRIQAALGGALARWPAGRYAVWYPIKLRRDRNAFHRWLRGHSPGPWLAAEFLVHPDNSALRLNGCGMAIIHPPWQFERVLDGILDALCTCLARDGFSARRIERGDGAPVLQWPE